MTNKRNKDWARVIRNSTKFAWSNRASEISKKNCGEGGAAIFAKTTRNLGGALLSQPIYEKLAYQLRPQVMQITLLCTYLEHEG